VKNVRVLGCGGSVVARASDYVYKSSTYGYQKAAGVLEACPFEAFRLQETLEKRPVPPIISSRVGRVLTKALPRIPQSAENQNGVCSNGRQVEDSPAP
jgi:hypothetical protein